MNEQQTTALTDHVLPLAPGFRQIGVSLYAHPAAAGLVTEPWDDYLTLVRLDVTVDDPTPPTLAWVDGGALLDGAWHRGDVCATLAFADAQSGLGAAWLESGAASASAWVAPRTGSQYQPGIPSAQPTLCLSAAALGDGAARGHRRRRATSARGQAAPLAFSVAIDATPPTASLVSPAAVATDAQPARARSTSADDVERRGVGAGADRRHDGAARPRRRARRADAPVAALAYGAHTLAWSVVDGAGNRTSAQPALRRAGRGAAGLRRAARPSNGAVLAAGDVLAVAVAVDRRRLRPRPGVDRA